MKIFNDRIIQEKVKNLNLFKNCEDFVTQQFIDKSIFYTLGDGEEIFSAFSAGKIFLIIEGRLGIKYYAEDGKEFLLGELDVGQWCGNDQTENSLPSYLTVEATGRTLVAKIDEEAFKDVVTQSPQIFVHMFNELGKLVWIMAERIINLGTLNVRGRMYMWLLESIKRSGVENNQSFIKSIPSHAVIASFLGTTREEVTREISLLKKKGVITISRKTIWVHDVSALQRGAKK